MPKLTQTTQVISCMGIVINKKENTIYVALLKDKDNCWVIPKGHVGNGENFVETAIREIKEETGITLNKNNFINKVCEYKYYTNKEKCEKLIKVYVFQKEKQDYITPLSKENFIDGKWITIDDAIEILKYQEQKYALNKVKKLFNKQK